MVMQVLRHALTKESDYTFANCFLYNHIGQNWDGNVDGNVVVGATVGLPYKGTKF